MKIAIDLRIKYNLDKFLSAFFIEFWKDTANWRPNHDFFFITDGKMEVPGIGNVQLRALKKVNIKWIDEWKLKRLFIDLRPDRIVTIKEAGFIIHPFYRTKKEKKNNGNAGKLIKFTDSKMPEFIQQGAAVFSIKPACKNVITSLTWAETESIKTQYSGGRDFFLFTGNMSKEHYLIELLQAFSIFKKWQQSNMQMVIAGYSTEWIKLLEEKLETYKYRSDVVILKNLSSIEIGKLVAASYAMLYPASENIYPLALIWAVQSGKAVIAADLPQHHAITEAAVWVPPKEITEGFAKAMILLYKDENYRQALVKQVNEEAVQYNREQMLAEVWQCIEQ